jgi:hypothetical protein
MAGVKPIKVEQRVCPHRNDSCDKGCRMSALGSRLSGWWQLAGPHTDAEIMHADTFYGLHALLCQAGISDAVVEYWSLPSEQDCARTVATYSCECRVVAYKYVNGALKSPAEEEARMDEARYAFWMVWVPGSTHGAPLTRHPTPEAAQAEAVRIAELVRQPAYVLECVGVADRHPQPVVFMPTVRESVGL